MKCLVDLLVDHPMVDRVVTKLGIRRQYDKIINHNIPKT
jgi:hypothetical protein